MYVGGGGGDLQPAASPSSSSSLSSDLRRGPGWKDGWLGLASWLDGRTDGRTDGRMSIYRRRGPSPPAPVAVPPSNPRARNDAGEMGCVVLSGGLSFLSFRSSLSFVLWMDTPSRVLLLADGSWCGGGGREKSKLQCMVQTAAVLRACGACVRCVLADASFRGVEAARVCIRLPVHI